MKKIFDNRFWLILNRILLLRIIIVRCNDVVYKLLIDMEIKCYFENE